MNLLDDLRFVIGLFFLLVASVLAASGSGPVPADSFGPGNLNLFAAGMMGCFSVAMLVMSFLFPMRHEHR